MDAAPELARRTSAGASRSSPLADGLQTAFDPHTAAPGFVGADLLVARRLVLVGSWLMMKFVRLPDLAG